MNLTRYYDAISHKKAHYPMLQHDINN